MAPTFCNRCGDSVEEGCDPMDELAELDALLERLKLKRYDLKRKINRFHSPIVRQLPPDVTSTIFEFCLPYFTDILPYFTDHPLLPYTKEQLSIPLSLGAICRDWRDIAWSTPSLWSSLVIRVPNRHDSIIATSIVAEEWLNRSGQLPLSIRIFSESHYKTISALAFIINRYSSRWFDLDFYIPDCHYRFFYATDNHAPILKSIRFGCSAHSVEKMKMHFQLTCPRLERASLSTFLMDGTNIYCQWDNLTHLTLHSMSIIDSFRILRKTPRLFFCGVSGFVPDEIMMEPNIGAPVVTSLRILELQTDFAEGFLNNLIAPHLEEFKFPNLFSSTMEVITSFLRRSACQCSLRSFSVIFYPPLYDDFMDLLQSIPSLNSLSILSSGLQFDPRYLLQLLAKVLSSQSTSLQQGFLPNLKILEYTGMLYLETGNYSELYSMPAADNFVHGPFHLLDLDISPVTLIPENMISYVSSLVERGVTVNVSSNSEDILQSSINYYKCRREALCRDWADNLDSSLFS